MLKQVQHDLTFSNRHPELVSGSHRMSGLLGLHLKDVHQACGMLKQVQHDGRFLTIRKNMLLKQGHVYIMSNQYRTTFYIGVTSDLESRVWQHVNGEGSAFVKKYKLYDLVFYEYFERITDAIDREKQLKNWHKDWKIKLIQSMNPEMKDLKDQLKT